MLDFVDRATPSSKKGGLLFAKLGARQQLKCRSSSRVDTSLAKPTKKTPERHGRPLPRGASRATRAHRSLHKAHQQRGRKPFAGYVSQNQSRVTVVRLENVVTISADFPGRHTSCREVHVHRAGVRDHPGNCSAWLRNERSASLESPARPVRSLFWDF